MFPHSLENSAVGCRVEARPATAVPLPALCPAQSRYPSSGGVRGVVETEELILTIFGEDTISNGCLNKTSCLNLKMRLLSKKAARRPTALSGDMVARCSQEHTLECRHQRVMWRTQKYGSGTFLPGSSLNY